MGKFKALGALLELQDEPAIDAPIDSSDHQATDVFSAALGITPKLIPLQKIKRSPFQPRQFFNPEKIAKMANKFREYRDRNTYPRTAVLVRPMADGYELVFGEQRTIAAAEAGFEDFLAFVDDSITDEEAMELAITENLLREDLNPLEKTDAILKLAAVRLQTSPEEIKRLLDKAANDRKQLTDNVIRSQQWQDLENFFQQLPDQITPESFRVNYLPLLNLPEEVLEVMRQGKLEYTKARAVGRVKDEAQRRQLLSEVIEQNLSVQKIRDRIKRGSADKSSPAADTFDADLALKRLSELTKQLKKSAVLQDPKKVRQLQGLLTRLEELITDNVIRNG